MIDEKLPRKYSRKRLDSASLPEPFGQVVERHTEASITLKNILGDDMTRDRIIRELHRINPGHGDRFAAWADEFGL